MLALGTWWRNGKNKKQKPSDKVASFQWLFWNLGLYPLRKQSGLNRAHKPVLWKQRPGTQEHDHSVLCVLSVEPEILNIYKRFHLKNGKIEHLLRIVSNNKCSLASEFIKCGNPTDVKMHSLSTYVCPYVCRMLAVSMMFTGNCQCFTNGRYMERNQEWQQGETFTKC